MRLVGIARIDIDRDHLEALAPQGPFERVERRHLLAARDAPGRPQIEQHGASAPIRQPSLGAGQVVEADVRHPQRGLGDRHRGHLSARERADTFGDLDRRPAIGIAPPIPYTPARPASAPATTAPAIRASRRGWGRETVFSGRAVTVRLILSGSDPDQLASIGPQPSGARAHHEQQQTIVSNNRS